MGYSKSPKTLDAFRENLAPIERGENVSWPVNPGVDKQGADRWAYRVRQALHIASLFPERYPVLAAAADLYVVEIVSPVEVQARRRSTRATPEGVAIDSPYRTSPEIQPDDASGMNTPISIVGPTTAREIIMHWLQRQQEQPTNTSMSYPNARLDTTQLDQLARWAATRTPPWYVLKPSHVDTITLSPKTVDFPTQLVWKAGRKDA